jgi:DNA-binding CsgD family transcriptional regulator
MPRGRKTALMVRLTLTERQALLAWQRSTTLPAGLVRRGRIILLVSEGKSISEIARTVGISRRFVYTWVKRYLAQGLEGLIDKPGRGGWRGQRRSPLATPPAVFPRGNATPGQ